MVPRHFFKAELGLTEDCHDFMTSPAGRPICMRLGTQMLEDNILQELTLGDVQM